MMAGDWAFDIRDYPKEQHRTDYKDFFRAHVALGVPELLGLEKGEPCILKTSVGPVGIVLVWGTSKVSKTRDIQISKDLQSLYGINPQEKVTLSKTNSELPNAEDVILYEVRPKEMGTSLPKLCRADYHHWAWILEEELKRAETIALGMVFDGVLGKRQRRSFKVQSVNNSRDALPFRFWSSCKVEVISDEFQEDSDATQLDIKNLVVSQEDLGGLGGLIQDLNERFAVFGDARNVNETAPSLPRWRNGIILNGIRGTGKSLLLRRIGQAGWRSVYNIDTDLMSNSKAGEKTAALRKVFADARNRQPSVILIDNLDCFAGANDSHFSGQATAISETLRQEMEGLGNFRTLVVATTRSLGNIDQALRSAHTFSRKIEIPVPDSRSRASILKALLRLPVDKESTILDSLARRTNGFVGADLAMLIIEAVEKANTRTSSNRQIEDNDFESALSEVRPSALGNVFVEIPDTRWSDIGGQEEAKDIIDRALNWPSEVSELEAMLQVNLSNQAQKQDRMKTFGLTPRRGLLLYGPPGCSKTMIARAAATESGHNFIAVKGAELLNMYVGESERKIREYFSLARSFRPSILFFDEIDALSTSRENGQQSSLHVVTTLLNELDGIEDLKDVLVLAATNRPDFIDSALLRSGRLDRMVFIGPPDLEARRYILNKRLHKVPVAENLNISALAEKTNGYSGAELMSICRDAAEEALSDSLGAVDLVKVDHSHFDKALTSVNKVITPAMLAYFKQFRESMRARLL